jgi:hypothetical protein
VVDLNAEVNGHHVVELWRVLDQKPPAATPACLKCGAHFRDRREAGHTFCPAAGGAHGHDLVRDPDDGLLSCSRCPLVAYDLHDAPREPICPMPLQSWWTPEPE